MNNGDLATKELSETQQDLDKQDYFSHIIDKMVQLAPIELKCMDRELMELFK